MPQYCPGGPNLWNKIMHIKRTGVILNTENYQACVDFYQKVFGLEILFDDQQGDFRLTCFGFGGSYLMVETGGKAQHGEKTMAQSASKLRFNVGDIDAALATLKAHDIDAEITRNDLGDTINCHDPDGNRIGIRPESSFSSQVKV